MIAKILKNPRNCTKKLMSLKKMLSGTKIAGLYDVQSQERES